MPKISIIIPVYMVEKYLDQCIQSVVNQTMRNIEIILIDDGSPDNSGKICDEYAKKDTRIKVIHQQNQGLGGARNTGINNSRGEFILFLDSDDWMELDACETMYNTAIKTSTDLVLSGETLFFDKTMEFKKGWRNFANKKPCYIKSNNFIKLFTPAWGRLYKTSFIKKNHLYFVEKCYYEDNSWGCFIILLADKISFVKNCFYYRQRSSSITGNPLNAMDWPRDFDFFINYIKINNIKSPKIKLAYYWYLIGYNGYYNLTPNKYKETFYKKIIANLDNMDLTTWDVIKLSLLNRQPAIKILKFFKYIKNGKYNIPTKKKTIMLLNLIPLLTIES